MYADFNPERDLKDPNFEFHIGMKFESVEQLRLVVRTYSIMKGKSIKPYTYGKKKA